MTLSEFIGILNTVKAEQGDLPVGVQTGKLYVQEPVVEVNLEDQPGLKYKGRILGGGWVNIT